MSRRMCRSASRSNPSVEAPWRAAVPRISSSAGCSRIARTPSRNVAINEWWRRCPSSLTGRTNRSSGMTSDQRECEQQESGAGHDDRQREVHGREPDPGEDPDERGRVPELVPADVERSRRLLPDLIGEPRDVGTALERGEDPPDDLRRSRHPEARREPQQDEPDASSGQADDHRGTPADRVGDDAGRRFEQQVRALQDRAQQHQLERTEVEAQDQEQAEDHAHHLEEEPAERQVRQVDGHGAHPSAHPSSFRSRREPAQIGRRGWRRSRASDMKNGPATVTRREIPDANARRGR